VSETRRFPGFSFATFLKLIFALALLSWVAAGLDWSDRLEFVPDPLHADEKLQVEGTIAGNWRGDTIRFTVTEERTLEDAWPEELRLARSEGRALEVTARPEAQMGYEWRPGMPRIFLGARRGPLALALGFLFLGVFFGVSRWWRILHLAGCPSTWRGTLRLTFLGLFFNLAMPGLTGGDLPKALLAVREYPERRADALATVVIDRLVGLWALVLLGTSMIWWRGGDFELLRMPSLAILGLLTAGLVGVLAQGPRRLLGLDRWIEKLPQGERLKKLERAALLYRGHPLELLGSVLLSMGNHLAVIAAIFFIGRALGDNLDFAAYVGAVPVANLITALPISPAGWGVGEKAFGTLFDMMGASVAIGVAISLTFRLCNVVLGLLGGFLLLLPGGDQARQVAREGQVGDLDRAPGN
jgi:uncharacterized membrane protein YbhN (UPF0104 family)